MTDTNIPDPVLQRLRRMTPDAANHAITSAMMFADLHGLDAAGLEAELPGLAARIDWSIEALRAEVEAKRPPPPFERDRGGRVIASRPANIDLAMKALGYGVWSCTFADETFIERDGVAERVSDDVMHRVRGEVEARFDWVPNKDAWKDWLLIRAARNQRDTLREYAEGVGAKWDGVARIERFLIEYGGAEDTPINAEFSRAFFLGAAARALWPGYKFDSVLVLEGEQGIHKSSVLEALVPNEDWFTDAMKAGAEAKQILEETTGCWIVEIPEAVGLRKAEAEAVKNQSSRKKDKARKAYSDFTTERKRRYVPVITTNLERYLKDVTGNRRFNPARITKTFDLKAVRAVRDQLWAEAVVLAKRGEYIGVRPEFWDLAAEATRLRLDDHGFGDFLAPLAEVYGEFRAMTLHNALGFEFDRFKADQVRLALKSIGWEKCKTKAANVYRRRPPGWAGELVPVKIGGRVLTPDGAEALAISGGQDAAGMALPVTAPDRRGAAVAALAVEILH